MIVVLRIIGWIFLFGVVGALALLVAGIGVFALSLALA